jgi:hypothetical protein
MVLEQQQQGSQSMEMDDPDTTPEQLAAECMLLLCPEAQYDLTDPAQATALHTLAAVALMDSTPSTTSVSEGPSTATPSTISHESSSDLDQQTTSLAEPSELQRVCIRMVAEMARHFEAQATL